jgi:hypothetical protein
VHVAGFHLPETAGNLILRAYCSGPKILPKLGPDPLDLRPTSTVPPNQGAIYCTADMRQRTEQSLSWLDCSLSMHARAYETPFAAIQRKWPKDVIASGMLQLAASRALTKLSANNVIDSATTASSLGSIALPRRVHEGSRRRLDDGHH